MIAQKRILSVEEMYTFLNNIPNHRDRALFTLCYITGRRISEITNLTREKVVLTRDPHNQPGYLVTVKILKKRKDVFIDTFIPLNDKMAQPFIAYVQYYDTQQLGKRLKTLFGIGRVRAWQIITAYDPEVNDHWFRHNRNTHFGMVMQPLELCAYMGWNSERMALRYTHSNPFAVAQRAKSLEQIRM